MRKGGWGRRSKKRSEVTWLLAQQSSDQLVLGRRSRSVSNNQAKQRTRGKALNDLDVVECRIIVFGNVHLLACRSRTESLAQPLLPLCVAGMGFEAWASELAAQGAKRHREFLTRACRKLEAGPMDGCCLRKTRCCYCRLRFELLQSPLSHRGGRA